MPSSLNMSPKSKKPIFAAAVPRACSTAFERVFMTRTEDLICVHEPFGEPFYYGPERLGERFKDETPELNEKREKSGYMNSTYRDVVQALGRLEDEGKKEGKRLFIKDIAYYLVPPSGQAHIAPSLHDYDIESAGNGIFQKSNGSHKNGERKSHSKQKSTSKGKIQNPTVLPRSLLSKFQFTFLIRHPRRTIPSYYRCTVPPLSHTTGFDHFLPSEAGYRELRALLEYLLAGKMLDDENGQPDVCLIDADDLLDKPKEVIKAYCEKIGLDFRETMLEWSNGPEACGAFDKWKGFHEDAIGSSGLRPREKKREEKSEEQEFEEWKSKFGEDGAKVIRQTVKDNVKDYEWLRSYKMAF